MTILEVLSCKGGNLSAMHWEMLDYLKPEESTDLLSGNCYVISHSLTHHVVGHFCTCKQATTGDATINAAESKIAMSARHNWPQNRRKQNCHRQSCSL